MLSPVIALVGDPDTRSIQPRRLAEHLGVPLECVAELAHTHRNTLTRSPTSPLVQSGLSDIVKILLTAASLLDKPSAADLAVLWFKNQPLSGFGGKTALDLVKEGRAQAVMEHLAMLADGVYA